MSKKPDPCWTFEEAWAFHLEEIRQNPSMQFDPSSQFSRWCGLQKLLQLQIQFEHGDQLSLMRALRECARTGLPMPDWVAKNYILAFDTILNYRAKSWDEVFGKPFPKGGNLNATKKKRDLKYAVLNDINAILQAKPDTPIDVSLFESVGQKYAIGKTLAAEYYYAVKASYKSPD